MVNTNNNQENIWCLGHSYMARWLSNSYNKIISRGRASSCIFEVLTWCLCKALCNKCKSDMNFEPISHINQSPIDVENCLFLAVRTWRRAVNTLQRHWPQSISGNSRDFWQHLCIPSPGFASCIAKVEICTPLCELPWETGGFKLLHV